MAKRLAAQYHCLSFSIFQIENELIFLEQFANKFKSSDISDLIVSMLLAAAYNTVSSAYLIMHRFLRTSTISFAKRINSKRPKMDLRAFNFCCSFA